MDFPGLMVRSSGTMADGGPPLGSLLGFDLVRSSSIRSGAPSTYSFGDHVLILLCQSMLNWSPGTTRTDFSFPRRSASFIELMSREYIVQTVAPAAGARDGTPGRARPSSLIENETDVAHQSRLNSPPMARTSQGTARAYHEVIPGAHQAAA